MRITFFYIKNKNSFLLLKIFIFIRKRNIDFFFCFLEMKFFFYLEKKDLLLKTKSHFQNFVENLLYYIWIQRQNLVLNQNENFFKKIKSFFLNFSWIEFLWRYILHSFSYYNFFFFLTMMAKSKFKKKKYIWTCQYL